jgi:hypothetical protein
VTANTPESCAPPRFQCVASLRATAAIPPSITRVLSFTRHDEGGEGLSFLEDDEILKQRDNVNMLKFMDTSKTRYNLDWLLTMYSTIL